MSLTGLERRVRLRDVARHGREQRDAVLGGGDGVGRGRVDDEAPDLGRGLEVDVVDPDARASHHPQPAPPRLQHLPRHLGAAPHDERVELGHLGEELGRGHAVGALHVRELPQHGEPGLAQLLRHQHRGLGPQRAVGPGPRDPVRRRLRRLRHGRRGRRQDRAPDDAEPRRACARRERGERGRRHGHAGRGARLRAGEERA